MKSQAKSIGQVRFPEFRGEKIYMLPFTLRDGLREFQHWMPTVSQMVEGLGVPADLRMFLMVDQGEVRAGSCHRRSGPHIDGNWIETIQSHGGGGTGGGSHDCGCHRPYRKSSTGYWAVEDFDDELLVLASDVSACAAYIGEIYGNPMIGGDCSHLDLSATEKMQLEANMAYAGNVFMVHESLPVPVDCKRTLVRLNIPGLRLP